MIEEEQEEQQDLEFQVAAEDAGQRLDVLLSRMLQAGQEETGCEVVPSRSKTSQWIAEGFVRVDFQRVLRPACRPAAGSLVSVSIPPPRPLTLEPDPEVRLQIVGEDDDCLVLNKEAGQVVHPGAGQDSGTIVQGLLHYLGPRLRQVGDALRPGIVHRLDKGTSGLLVVAKNERAYQALTRQFLPPRTITRRYLALAAAAPRSPGKPAAGHGVIEAPIGRDRRERKKMSVAASGRPAATQWEVKEKLLHGVLLELVLQTGRTHQIRVHLQQAGAPVIGDPVYGGGGGSLPPRLRDAAARFGRQALHAYSLSFIHPSTGERVCYEAAPPAEMAELIKLFRGA